MRKIKFRAWDIKNGRMLFGDLKIFNSIAPFCNNPKNFLIMQFTSLRDKNGKEIYEGDIVRQTGTDWDRDADPADLEYNKEPQKEIMRDIVSLRRFRYWLKNETFGYEGENRIDPSDCTIIGNIYENPEIKL